VKVLHVTREPSAYGLGRAVLPLVQGLNELASADQFSSAELSPTEERRAETRARWLARLCPAGTLPTLRALWRAWATGRAAGKRARALGCSHLHAHDVVVAAGARRALAGGIAWGFSQHAFHPIATALHEYVHPLPRWLRVALTMLERRTVRAAAWIVFPTAAGRDHLARCLSLTADARWRVIPHARPAWTLPGREEARARLGFSPALRYLLAVGQLITLKRFDWIVRAMGQAPDEWRLVLLGGGDAAPYLRLADALGIPQPIVASTDEPAAYFAAADAYASASRTESFGIANLEALSAGLPALCTAVDAVPEVVGDAAWSSADDEATFAALLNRLLRSAESRQELSARALARVAGWPDQRAVTEQHLAAYGAANGSRP